MAGRYYLLPISALVAGLLWALADVLGTLWPGLVARPSRPVMSATFLVMAFVAGAWLLSWYLFVEKRKN